MAVVSAGERWPRRSSANEKGEREYSRTFVIVTDDPDDDESVVREATGLPRMFDAFPGDVGARVVRIDPERDDDNRSVWTIGIDYSSNAGDPERQQENPLERPAEIVWDGIEYLEVLAVDLDGKAVINSAGQPFDPAVEVPRSMPVLTIAKNVALYEESFALQYSNAINADTFFGFQPGEVLCKKLPGQLAYENGISFWRVSAELHMKPNGTIVLVTGGQPVERLGWDVVVVDAGYYALNGSGELVPIKDAEQKAVKSIARLNGVGVALPADTPTEESVWRKFRGYRSVNFGPLKNYLGV